MNRAIKTLKIRGLDSLRNPNETKPYWNLAIPANNINKKKKKLILLTLK